MLESDQKRTARGLILNGHPDLLTSLVKYVSQRTVHTLSTYDHEGEQALKDRRPRSLWLKNRIGSKLLGSSV